jgi:hypothetical protein
MYRKWTVSPDHTIAKSVTVVSMDRELRNLERRMGILSPPAKSEERYHAQESLTPIIKVEDLEPIEMPQFPREMHSD